MSLAKFSQALMPQSLLIFVIVRLICYSISKDKEAFSTETLFLVDKNLSVILYFFFEKVLLVKKAKIHSHEKLKSNINMVMGKAIFFIEFFWGLRILRSKILHFRKKIVFFFCFFLFLPMLEIAKFNKKNFFCLFCRVTQ